MIKFYDKYKKFFIALVIIGITFSIYNYDKIAAKVIKKLPISIENYLAEQYMPDKFWLHRTDSVEKQYEFTSKYKGIEFDIIYYKDEIALYGNVDAVSFYGGYYDFIKSVELPPRIELLTWLDGYTWYEVLLRKNCEEIKNDKRIQVILVKDIGHYHR